MSITVFVVDDDAIQLQLTAEILRERCGYHVVTALGGRAAIERFLLRMQPQPDVVLLDLIMPEISGVDVVKAIRLSDAHTPIIMLSPRDPHHMVMDAVRAGANDWLHKPANVQFLKLTIEKHVQREQMRCELSRLERYQRSIFSFDDIIGKSAAMQRSFAQAKEAAAQWFPVCIEGEAGTGKELFARAIHCQSQAGLGHFVTVHGQRSELPDVILSAEHGSGAPHWPSEWGHFSQGATLFIRHLNAMPLAQQEQLAAFLNHKQRFNSPQWDKLRVIASVQGSLAQAYRDGQIACELMAYFSVMRIQLPLLAERDGDIELLASHFLQRFTASQPVAGRKLDAPAIKLLASMPWRTNVLELLQLMQRAAFYVHEPVLGAHILSVLLEHPDMPMLSAMERMQYAQAPRLPSDYRLLTARGDVKPFEEIEADILRFAISHYRGRMTEVARKLGIGRSTLYRKMQDYHLREEMA